MLFERRAGHKREHRSVHEDGHITDHSTTGHNLERHSHSLEQRNHSLGRPHNATEDEDTVGSLHIPRGLHELHLRNLHGFHGQLHHIRLKYQLAIGWIEQ